VLYGTLQIFFRLFILPWMFRVWGLGSSVVWHLADLLQAFHLALDVHDHIGIVAARLLEDLGVVARHAVEGLGFRV
jgi:hypothetical protein